MQHAEIDLDICLVTDQVMQFGTASRIIEYHKTDNLGIKLQQGSAIARMQVWQPLCLMGLFGFFFKFSVVANSSLTLLKSTPDGVPLAGHRAGQA
jgi:hypothetical protein